MNQKSLPSHTSLEDKDKQFKRRSQIIQMLKTYPQSSNRSLKIITELMILLQEEPFFKILSNNYRILSQISQKIQYQQFKPNEIIYNIKEKANKFYILLSGSVRLTTSQIIGTSEDDNGLFHKQQTKEISQKLKLNSFLHINRNLILIEEGQNDKLIKNSNQMKGIQKIIKIIQKGQCFGEMMGQDSVRVAKAIAEQKCEVFTMEKSAYQAFLKVQMKSQSLSKYKFISNISLFQGLSIFTIERLSLQLLEKTLNYGQILYRQGENINSIFIIREGQFKLIKQVKSSQQTTDKRIGLIQYKKQSKHKKQMPYRIIEPGQILGDIETLSFYQQYKQICICCSQQAIVFSIDKRIFFQILMEDQQNFQKVNKLMKQKNKSQIKSALFFNKKNTRHPLISSILNDQFTSQKRQFQFKRKRLASSYNRLNIQEVYNDQKLVFNEINKTIQKNVNLNRFTVNKKKCVTEATSPQPQIKKKRKNIPHSIKDIVQLVKQKTVFQRRFRKSKRQEKQLFTFDSNDAPLYIKSRYKKLQNAI